MTNYCFGWLFKKKSIFLEFYSQGLSLSSQTNIGVRVLFSTPWHQVSDILKTLLNGGSTRSVT